MKAFVYRERGILEKKELADPVLKPGDEADSFAAVLSPLFLSPCSSDVHTVYEGAGPRRRDLVLGHEGIAKVLEAGSEVHDFHPGDIVVPSAVMPERGDISGHRGEPFSAAKLGRNIDGMWAEKFVVPDADMNLSLLPEGLSTESALMAADMMATGATAAEEAGISEGTEVLIIGSGAVGLMAAFFAAYEKKALVSMIGSSHAANIEAAIAFGVRNYISYRSGAALFGSDIPDTKLFDRVIIAGGGREAFKKASDLVKYGTGIIVNVSYIEGTDFIELPIFSLGRGMSGKTIKFCLSRGGRSWTERMLSAALKAESELGPMRAPGRLVTHRFYGFDRIPYALSLMHERPDGLIKPMVDLQGEVDL